jgi:hypothetical protein
MFIDNALYMANAQSITTGASTDYVDLIANGATKDLKLVGFSDVWAVLRTPVAFTTDKAGDTVTFTLQHGDLTSFLDGVTLNTSGAVAKATLIAGYEIMAVKLPRNLKRYVRAYMTVSTSAGTIATGKMDAYLVRDYDKLVGELNSMHA